MTMSQPIYHLSLTQGHQVSSGPWEPVSPLPSPNPIHTPQPSDNIWQLYTRGNNPCCFSFAFSHSVTEFVAIVLHCCLSLSGLQNTPCTVPSDTSAWGPLSINCECILCHSYILSASINAITFGLSPIGSESQISSIEWIPIVTNNNSHSPQAFAQWRQTYDMPQLAVCCYRSTNLLLLLI